MLFYRKKYLGYYLYMKISDQRKKSDRIFIDHNFPHSAGIHIAFGCELIFLNEFLLVLVVKF